MPYIKITVEGMTFKAELNDSATAQAVYASLPLAGTANVWGDEIYFSIPLNLDSAPDAREVVEVGDLGYWPAGTAFCIFFGPTPVSTDEQPKAYSPVNIFGRLMDDPLLLKTVADGAAIRVTPLDA